MGPKPRIKPITRDLKHQRKQESNAKESLKHLKNKGVEEKERGLEESNMSMLLELNHARVETLNHMQNSTSHRHHAGIKLNSKIGYGITFLFLCSLMQNAEAAVRENNIDMTGGDDVNIHIDDITAVKHGLISLEGSHVGHLKIETVTQVKDELVSNINKVFVATDLNNTKIKDSNLDIQAEFNTIIAASGIKEIIIEDKGLTDNPSSYAAALSSLKKISADDIVDATLKITLPSEKTQHTIIIEADKLRKLRLEESIDDNNIKPCPPKASKMSSEALPQDTIKNDASDTLSVKPLANEKTNSPLHNMRVEETASPVFKPLKDYYKEEMEYCRQHRQKDASILRGICSGPGEKVLNFPEQVFYRQGNPSLGEVKRVTPFELREISDFRLAGGSYFIDHNGNRREYRPSEVELEANYQYQKQAQEEILQNIGGDDGLALAVVQVAISPNGDPHRFRAQVGTLDERLAFDFSTPETSSQVGPLTLDAFKAKLKAWASASSDFNVDYQSGGWTEGTKMIGSYDAGIPAFRLSTIEKIKAYAELTLERDEISWAQTQMLEAIIQASKQSLAAIRQKSRNDINSPNSNYKRVFSDKLAAVADNFPYQEKIFEHPLSDFEKDCIAVNGMNYRACGIDKNRLFNLKDCLAKYNAQDCDVDERTSSYLKRKYIFSLG